MNANQQYTNNPTEEFVLLCVDISPKFKEYVVLTTDDDIKGCIERSKERTQCKLKQRLGNNTKKSHKLNHINLKKNRRAKKHDFLIFTLCTYEYT